MPTYTIHCHTPLVRSFRVEQVAGLFDLPLDEIESRLAHELTVELPGLEEEWTIGAIVGPSGSGKTTLARAVYEGALYDPPPWPNDAAVIDCLGDLPIKQITRTLTAVGLGSVPTWLKPYHVLSTGERFRADLARALLGVRNQESGVRYQKLTPDSCPLTPQAQRLLVIDEFTSTLDRTIAQTASAALARLLRNPKSEIQNPKLIVLTCHTDILPWLAPDWTLDLVGSDRRAEPVGSICRMEPQTAAHRQPATPGPARQAGPTGTPEAVFSDQNSTSPSAASRSASGPTLPDIII